MNKKVLIIGGIIGTIALAVFVSLAIIKLVSQKSEITVVFDAAGGVEVEKMKVEKGSTITMPTTSKEGYNFLGWYDEDQKKAESTMTITSYTKFTAQWEEIPKENTFTITFDSRGGSEVNKLVWQCDKELTFPTSPSKEGYTFMHWEDKNETPILEKALLACEDVTLYAKWEKKEEPKKEETKKTETPKEPVKKYTCPEGYTLNGTKCTIEGTVKEKCEGERVFDYEGKCVTINYSVRKDTQASCGKTTVHTGGGHTEEVQGELFKMGTNYCFFKIVTDSYENNQSNCTSRGHFWNSQNSKCYYYRGSANQFVTNTCDHLTGYAYITNPNSYSGVNGLNGGCYPVSNKKQYCDSDYTLTNGKCIKTVEATLQ